ncbi:MAG: histidine phosphatase family protein [Acidimicrobiales bacterium]
MASNRTKKAGPTLVLFVRHGQTPTTGKILPGRAPGLHLSDEGRAEADTAAARIAPLKGRVAAVYASPLERTRQTAAPIAKTLGLRVRTDRRLLDSDTGDWTNEELKTLRKRPEWRVVQHNPSSFRFPGGESFLEMLARLNDALSDFVDRHRGELVVVVSHAEPIRVAVATAIGAPFDLFQRVIISPCSISVVAYGDDGPAVLCANSSHRDLAGLVGR